VSCCFAQGTTEMHVVGALDTSGVPMKSVLCLHETVCTGAADGYGRMKQKPAATLLHLGVGLANGVANLHNARRGRSPVVNVIGEMSTFLKDYDPLLNMDIEAVAKTVSGWTHTVKDAKSLADSVFDAVRSSKSSGDPLHNRVSTLIVPHDFAYEESVQSSWVHRSVKSSFDGAEKFIKGCADALRSSPRGKKAIYVSGSATISENGNFQALGRIASAVGAKLLVESVFSRVDRGVGMPHAVRLPYFPEDALRELSKYDILLCVDARRPVAMFGYHKGPTELISLGDDDIWDIDSSTHITDAIRMLEKEVHAERIQPGKNCGGMFMCDEARPKLPSNMEAALTAVNVCKIIAHAQPRDCIIVDESITSGGTYYDESKACPPFSHLCLTGGAIGTGPPMSVGAAFACPDRRVINFQADGSALYSLQALWTQAREKLNVVTVICKNSKYAILTVELGKQRVRSSNHAENLTNLSNPPINWIGLAEGFGVACQSVKTNAQFLSALQTALAYDGPYLIEACF